MLHTDKGQQKHVGYLTFPYGSVWMFMPDAKLPVWVIPPVPALRNSTKRRTLITWAMCGHCFVRKKTLSSVELWWFRRAGWCWSVSGTVIRGPGQYAAVSCLKSHLHFLWQSSTGHILSQDSVTSTENHFENGNRHKYHLDHCWDNH